MNANPITASALWLLRIPALPREVAGRWVRGGGCEYLDRAGGFR